MKSTATTRDNAPSLQEPYHRALKLYLRGETAARLRSARTLGRRAVKLGLETLDLAIIHENAILENIENVSTAAARACFINKARVFFAEAILSIEESHRAAKVANTRLSQLNAALKERTCELDTSNRQLLKEVTRRQVVEKHLRLSEQQATALLSQSQMLQEQLRFLSRRILSVQEEEKKRISRDLHDLIAQMLSSINIRLDTLRTDLTANAKGLNRDIQSTQRLVRKSVDIVHRFARELRPAVLDDLGLVAALRSFVKTYSRQTRVQVDITVFAGIAHLGNNECTVLYRVAQEALGNVSRHARANRVDLSIRKHGDSVSMLIKDNGRSFDVQKVLQGRKRKGLGLLGMRERVEMVGGTFTVVSVPGTGTTIRADIPFTECNKEDVRK
jgi:signal transduction histidine kinase